MTWVKVRSMVATTLMTALLSMLAAGCYYYDRDDYGRYADRRYSYRYDRNVTEITVGTAIATCATTGTTIDVMIRTGVIAGIIVLIVFLRRLGNHLNLSYADNEQSPAAWPNGSAPGFALLRKKSAGHPKSRQVFQPCRN